MGALTVGSLKLGSQSLVRMRMRLDGGTDSRIIETGPEWRSRGRLAEHPLPRPL